MANMRDTNAKRKLPSISLMKWLLAALTILVIADGLITQFVVGAGIASEGNPIMQPIVDSSTFLFAKVVGALVCAFLLWDIFRRWAKLALISTSFLVVCYLAIVIWNLFVFFTAS